MKSSRNWALALVVLIVFTTQEQLKANPAGSGSGVPAIVADVFIARPLGIMATLAGSALYVVSLPFTVPARGTEQAKRVLVDYPFHYTFSRPLGEFHDDDF
jgi:hypothetical protein|tara:strand:- start:859 stop:1161 length:303 start_codon:yes stop_codon:yes gene_type:complete